MIGRLLQKLIKEVPCELSICEFECSMTNCTVRDWTECELFHQASLRGCGVTHYNTPIMHIAHSVAAAKVSKVEIKQALSCV